MVAAFVQSATGGTSTTKNPTIPFPAATKVAGFIVVASVDDSGTTGYIPIPTDNKGSTYQSLLSAEFGATGSALNVWTAQNVAGGSGHVITLPWTGASSGIVAYGAQEFSGVDTTAPLDKQSAAIATGNSTAAASAATPATTASGIVIGVIGSESTAAVNRTATGGYGNLVTAGSNTGYWVSIESLITTATGTQTATMTLATAKQWGATAFAFKAAGSTPPTANQAPFFALLGW